MCLVGLATSMEESLLSCHTSAHSERLTWDVVLAFPGFLVPYATYAR